MTDPPISSRAPLRLRFLGLFPLVVFVLGGATFTALGSLAVLVFTSDEARSSEHDPDDAVWAVAGLVLAALGAAHVAIGLLRLAGVASARPVMVCLSGMDLTLSILLWLPSLLVSVVVATPLLAALLFANVLTWNALVDPRLSHRPDQGEVQNLPLDVIRPLGE